MQATKFYTTPQYTVINWVLGFVNRFSRTKS